MSGNHTVVRVINEPEIIAVTAALELKRFQKAPIKIVVTIAGIITIIPL